MATVGQQLTAPETGWKRYDDTDSNISYNGKWLIAKNDPRPYNYTSHYIKNPTIPNGSVAKFNFTGSKLRVISTLRNDMVDSVIINIDGVIYNYSENSSTTIYQALIFEKINLSHGEHYVTITPNKTSGVFDIDAFDIDETGQLKPYAPIVAPTNLVATAGDSQVTLSWTTVDGATSYNVKRSTTSGGTYTTIASNVTDTSYVDTSVTNGTTYYYVVTAVNADGESTNSNEASAKPVDSSKVLLVITMSDDVQKEYELSKEELDAFVSWYNNRSAGNGLPYYIFNKSFNLGPFDSRKDYIVFSKIENFEVMKFSK